MKLRIRITIWLMNVQLNKTIKHRDRLIEEKSHLNSPFILAYNTAISRYESTIMFLKSQLVKKN